MFLHSCSIDLNTSRLRHCLTNLGYHLYKGNWHGDHLMTFEEKGEWFYRAYYGGLDSDKEWNRLPENCIDCGTNEELFKAVAAMNNENDYMQWFITEADQFWVNPSVYYPKGSLIFCKIKYRYPKEWWGKEKYCSSIVPAHKATVSELCELLRK